MTTSKLRLTITLAAVLCAACGGSEPYQPRNLEMTRINAWWGLVDRVETYVIKSEAEWQTVWQVHEPPTWPKTERPSIDFSRKMVVGITQGAGPNGCYGLAITRVVEEEYDLRVEFNTLEPEAEYSCTLSVVPLTDFVEIPRSDKPVSFQHANP